MAIHLIEGLDFFLKKNTIWLKVIGYQFQDSAAKHHSSPLPFLCPPSSCSLLSFLLYRKPAAMLWASIWRSQQSKELRKKLRKWDPPCDRSNNLNSGKSNMRDQTFPQPRLAPKAAAQVNTCIIILQETLEPEAASHTNTQSLTPKQNVKWRMRGISRCQILGCFVVRLNNKQYNHLPSVYNYILDGTMSETPICPIF